MLVEKFIAKERWHVTHDSASLLRRAAKQGGGPPVTENVRTVLMADFGGYFIFFGTRETYGLWAFDDQSRLVDVWIYKENDVL